MATCRNCGVTGDSIVLNRFGMCRKCSEKHHTLVADCIHIMNQIEALSQSRTQNPSLLAHYETILAKLHKLLPYEKKGISAFEKPIHELIEQYIHMHDLVIHENDFDDMKTALSAAEELLEPFGRSYAVKKVFHSIYEAQKQFRSPPKNKIFAVINQKGGVGKTTAAINIGAGLARQDMNILLIDFDPQANLTDAMGILDSDVFFSVYDILKGDIHSEEAIIRKNGIHVLPASVLLARADKEFSDVPNAYFLLKNILADIQEYDYVFVDCLPSLGILTLNALMAAHEVIIPVLPEYFALTGVRKLLDALEYIKEEGNPDISINSVLFNRFDPRKGHHRDVRTKLQGFFGNSILYFTIRESIALSEAASMGKSIFQYRRGSKGAHDYQKICSGIIETDRNTNDMA